MKKNQIKRKVIIILYVYERDDEEEEKKPSPPLLRPPSMLPPSVPPTSPPQPQPTFSYPTYEPEPSESSQAEYNAAISQVQDSESRIRKCNYHILKISFREFRNLKFSFFCYLFWSNSVIHFRQHCIVGRKE